MKSLIPLALVSAAFAQLSIDTFYAGRLFPYVKYIEVWTGTLAVIRDATVPNSLVVHTLTRKP